MSETRATEVRDAMNLVARAAEHVAEYVYQDDADSVLLREAIRILRGAVASPGPTESDRRDTERLDGKPDGSNAPTREEMFMAEIDFGMTVVFCDDDMYEKVKPFLPDDAICYPLQDGSGASVGSSNATEEGAK